MDGISPVGLCGWAWVVFAIGWTIAAQFVRAATWSETRLQRLQHSLPLLAGFVLIFYVGQARWRDPPIGRLYTSPPLGWLGLGLTVAGLLFAAWARAHLGRYWSGTITLKAGHRLIRTGPYRLARHPIYTGFLTATLGSALSAATGAAFAGFAIIAIAIVLKLRREESLLTREFGEEYRQFQREVPALVPYVY